MIHGTIAMKNMRTGGPPRGSSRKQKAGLSQPRPFFLDVKMNWWLALVLVLPLLISWKTQDVGLPRFQFLLIFLLLFPAYFFLVRAKSAALTLPRPGAGLLRALAGLAAAFT